jgi:hypothetical protein
MHLPIDRYVAWKQFDDRESKRTPAAAPVEAYQMLPPLAAYPARIPDRGFHPIIGSWAVPPRVMPDDRLPGVAAIRRAIRRTGRRLSYPALGLTVLSTNGTTITLDGS